MRVAGIPIESRFYLFGNAVTGQGLFRYSGTAGLGAPTRFCVSQRDGEETRIDINLPSSFFIQFPELTASPVPAELDTRMIPLLEKVASQIKAVGSDLGPPPALENIKEVTMGAEHKVAVITGASQGIGAALVKAYRDRSYRVVATARSIKPSRDADILVARGDIADRETAESAISTGIVQFGRIDTLVNNAGIFIAKPFTQYTEADYAAILGVNLAGFFHITQLAVAEMEKQGSGHIVQITTSLVNHAIAGVRSVLASLTKGGLAAATKSLAIEYAQRGIRVNAVAPGTIKTPMHSPETYTQLAALHPVGRLGEISDIVDAILYLEEAGFVTGEILHVDGGQSAGH